MSWISAVAIGVASMVFNQPGEAVDPRSVELLHYECRVGEERHATTLFGNGTIRRLVGKIATPEMRLLDLDPDRLDAFVARLQQESLEGSSWNVRSRLEGRWLEACTLALDVEGGPKGATDFSAFDALSLDVSRIVSIANELSLLADSEYRLEGLDPAYVPRPGDVLLHRDGSRYRVHNTTSDGRGVELNGIEQPLTVYFALEALSNEFLGVEERRR